MKKALFALAVVLIAAAASAAPLRGVFPGGPGIAAPVPQGDRGVPYGYPPAGVAPRGARVPRPRRVRRGRGW